jgi:Mrp family chromosome partitioning ATPase
MTKIYEALRRHEEVALTVDPPPVPAPAPSYVGDRFLAANREMQGLYRAVESSISPTQTGAMLLFASAHAREGKTTVCGSFGATLAQNFDKSVLILDADRDHTLSHHWNLEQQKEVTLAALGKAPESIQQSGKRLGTRGTISVVPMPIGSLRASAQADRPEFGLIASIKDRLTKVFDYVLIDVPAAADASWVSSIGAITDGVIVVVEAERTRWPVVVNLKREFETSGARVLGVFLNKRRYYIPPRIYRHL